MLPKNRRISKKDFPYILAKGKRFNSLHLLLYVVKNPIKSSLKSQISFSVSKKVCGGAVGRNTLRRYGYRVVVGNLSKIEEGYFLFFSFKKGSKGLSYEVIENEVLELLSSSNMII